MAHHGVDGVVWTELPESRVDGSWQVLMVSTTLYVRYCYNPHFTGEAQKVLPDLAHKGIGVQGNWTLGLMLKPSL